MDSFDFRDTGDRECFRIYSEKGTLSISRPEGKVSLTGPPKSKTDEIIPIWGVLGMINLLSGPFLLVIAERERLCSPDGIFKGHQFYRILTVQILPCHPAPIEDRLEAAQIAEETEYLRLLHLYVEWAGLYYSRSYDLTERLQSQYGRLGQPILLSQADPAFLANRALLEAFGKVDEIEQFIVIAIEGCKTLCILSFSFYIVVEWKQLCYNPFLQIGLISRRCVGRSGTRYHSRGIDESENVSNCVETEQLLVIPHEAATCSFVQLRGSIPLYWRQTINLRYQPPMDLHEDPQGQSTTLRLHLRALLEKYGSPLTILNLVKRGGWEGRLAREFAGQVDRWSHPQIRYLHFDFHAETTAGRWISGTRRLLSVLMEDLHEQSYLLLANDQRKEQKGIFRVNCIDCLDRTNVAQGILARQVLEAQLSEILGDQAKSLSSVDSVFRNLWADNGDAISTHYAGTGALKSDFTRTGRRGLVGQLRDLINSITRYVIGNFYDGARQDGMDLWYGHFKVSQERSNFLSFEGGAHVTIALAPILLKAFLVVFAACWLLQLTGMAPKFLNSRLSMTLLAAAILLLVGWICRNAVHFVQYPRLIPPPAAVCARAAARLPLGRSMQQRLLDIYRQQGPHGRKVHAI